ncbi:hypothetical protein PRK78_005807 [Emydomyces testavorans]|uniref:SMI1/KNR4 family protein n=1 Tax=Emydomyces testavorans TaxID=2070801 RepID=A0AAF0DME2_9EURO|nr:hypothetical protein PRK78_005807 [Emydomyces testavorans]
MPHKPCFDLHSSLAACQNDPAARWRFLHHFAQYWTSAPLTDDPQPAGNDKSTDDHLTAAEQRLALTLPNSLTEAYKLLGQRPDLTSNQDKFLAPYELYIYQPENEAEKEDIFLVFRTENQGAAVWGMPVSSSNPDPPVFVRLSLFEKEGEKWLPWTSSFSEALVELVLSESMFDPTALTYINSEECHRLELEARFAKLQFPRYHPDSESTLSWFTHGPDLLLRHDGSELMIRARTDDAVRQLKQEHGDLFSNPVLNRYI